MKRHQDFIKKIFIILFILNNNQLINVSANVEDFKYLCFTADETDNFHRFASKKITDSIGIQVSNRVTHQLTSRIFSIVLKELLGYRNVKLIDINVVDDVSEHDKIFQTLEELVPSQFEGKQWHEPTLDLEVWMLPEYNVVPAGVESAGSLTHPGRYGWFIPTILLKNNDLPELLPYTMFSKNKTDIINKFSIDNDILRELIQFTDIECLECHDGIFTPPQCIDTMCAYLLAPRYFDTYFTIKHILHLKLYIKVIFLGENLHELIRELLYTYQSDPKYSNMKFMIMHWTPSEIIDGVIDYTPITMPRCEMLNAHDGCKYELTPIVKYYSNILPQAEYAEYALLKTSFKKHEMKSLLLMYENTRYNSFNISQQENDIQLPKKLNFNIVNLKNKNKPFDLDEMYNKIACDWLRSHNSTYSEWIAVAESKEIIQIGGIFPMTNFHRGIGIYYGATLAHDAINSNPLILPKHELRLIRSNGGCQSDMVMKNFINFYIKQKKMIGVLGPACSETIEPIAGVSKHIRMPIISYSAEGASFSDRDTYPYIFRTIGENNQYENIYLQFFKTLGWKRFAALTEDGQKYTEYITHMEILMKNHGIEMIINKKFPRMKLENVIEKTLEDLRSKNSKIIIADIHEDTLATIVMCNAFKHNMTAKYGYVWFLPVWLSTKSIRNSNHTYECTQEQLNDALNGHFSLQHASYGNHTELMQENITIQAWKDKYSKYCKRSNVSESEYATFAYDAVWVYAYAVHKLIEENPAYLSDLHSAKTTSRLMELIWATDFYGVSGRVKFSDSGSRYSVINVLQNIKGELHTIASFYPNISTLNPRLIYSWDMYLNESAIRWITKNGKPDDGTIKCALEGFANFFNMNCDNAVLLLASLLCILFVIALSVGSFLFWKHKYDKKLEKSAKYMQTLGLDLLSKLPENSLDKWEIPKDRVVINRKLGEGAFGTVYGGEAQIQDDNIWTAVAVKTLKLGSTRESQVDFLAEAEIMKRFDHKNIIKLLGVCRLSEPIFTIMEFMLYGDLKTYLLARRHLVNSTKYNSEDSDFSPKRLTSMALDVARALVYLNEQKYVHRDIACRNCLVNAERVIKLGDFGMARSMCDNDFYKFSRKGMLPVRWMAPESLVLGIFSSSSDIWSYGVLLYEIITFGSFPFQGLTNNQVLEHIKEGNTLGIPNGVKSNLERLMRACWSQNPKSRPTAKDICDFLQNHTSILTPCIDAPLSSVQMAETESDQLDIFPGIRKRSLTPNNGMKKSNTLNNFDLNHTYNNTNAVGYIKMNNLNVPSHLSSDQPVSSNNIYNPIEPLLESRDSEVTKSNSSLRKYMPMCGFNKTRASSPDQEYEINTSLL